MSTLGRISMGRFGACVLALAVCCGFACQIDSARDADKQHGYQVNGEDKPSHQNETADSRSHSATTRGSSGGGTIGGRALRGAPRGRTGSR